MGIKSTLFTANPCGRIRRRTDARGERGNEGRNQKKRTNQTKRKRDENEQEDRTQPVEEKEVKDQRRSSALAGRRAGGAGSLRWCQRRQADAPYRQPGWLNGMDSLTRTNRQEKEEREMRERTRTYKRGEERTKRKAHRGKKRKEQTQRKEGEGLGAPRFEPRFGALPTSAVLITARNALNLVL
eukprot:SAG11_NODE_83_length_17378_cov_5.388622_7_plen_184_part_00